MALSDKQQAGLMFAVFVFPALIAWLSNGSPTDRTSLSLLGAAILSGVLALFKEFLGGKEKIN